MTTAISSWRRDLSYRAMVPSQSISLRLGGGPRLATDTCASTALVSVSGGAVSTLGRHLARGLSRMGEICIQRGSLLIDLKRRPSSGSAGICFPDISIQGLHTFQPAPQHNVETLQLDFQNPDIPPDSFRQEPLILPQSLPSKVDELGAVIGRLQGKTCQLSVAIGNFRGEETTVTEDTDCVKALVLILDTAPSPPSATFPDDTQSPDQSPPAP